MTGVSNLGQLASASITEKFKNTIPTSTSQRLAMARVLTLKVTSLLLATVAKRLSLGQCFPVWAQWEVGRSQEEVPVRNHPVKPSFHFQIVSILLMELKIAKNSLNGCFQIPSHSDKEIRKRMTSVRMQCHSNINFCMTRSIRSGYS